MQSRRISSAWPDLALLFRNADVQKANFEESISKLKDFLLQIPHTTLNREHFLCDLQHEFEELASDANSAFSQWIDSIKRINPVLGNWLKPGNPNLDPNLYKILDSAESHYSDVRELQKDLSDTIRYSEYALEHINEKIHELLRVLNAIQNKSGV